MVDSSRQKYPAENTSIIQFDTLKGIWCNINSLYMTWAVYIVPLDINTVRYSVQPFLDTNEYDTTLALFLFIKKGLKITVCRIYIF